MKKKNWRKVKLLLSVCLISMLFGAVMVQSTMARTEITYWGAWTGSEYDVAKEVVDAFNASQNEIYVNFLSMSDIATKFYTAVAAGDPPDLVHVYSYEAPTWIKKGALQPIDDIGIDLSVYVQTYLGPGSYNNSLYALPITPGMIALLRNKTILREAGLDPSISPRTIDEFKEYTTKLTKYAGGDPSRDLVRLGFDPLQPNWFAESWFYFFGAKIYDPQTGKITLNSPGGLAAMEWLRDFTVEFGLKRLQAFRAGYGPSWSAENPFISGKLAMGYDGIWMPNMINEFVPDFDWGVAPFPSVDGKKRVYFEWDGVAIPVGAKNPEAAKKFLGFYQKPENLEHINIGQWKIPPLKELSGDFYRNHPNKRIGEYVEIIETAELFGYPSEAPAWAYASGQIYDVLMEKVTLLTATPQEALELVQANIEKEEERYQ